MSTLPRRRNRLRSVLIVAGVVLAALLGYLYSAGIFDRDPVHMFDAQGPRAPVAALYFSGDTGLRFGMGAATTKLLAAHGIETVGFNSSTMFRTRQTLTQTNMLIAEAVRQALARTGSRRIVLIGQSYGADVLQTGLAGLSADLRARVAGIILVVPGNTVFLRADPSGFVYRGTPDSIAATTARTLDWAPLTCIYGVEETDSLCPLLHVRGAHVIGMPGGHFLNRDADALGAHVLRAVARSITPVRP